MHQGERILVGVSGGADSVCLFLLLLAVAKEWDLQLAVVHVDHGIRGEDSRADAEFVRQLCRTHDVFCYVYAEDVPARCREMGLGLEEGARLARYGCFAQAAKAFGAQKLALAHHGNDQAETLLFRLARGTGLRGLCGMRPVTDHEGLTVIRPLLCVSREEIENWLALRGQEYCTDATNAQVVPARNRIRHRVIPQLEEVNAQAVLHLQQLSLRLQEVWDYLEEEALRLSGEISRCREEAGEVTEIRIDRSAFLAQPQLLQKCLLSLWLDCLGGQKDVGAVHLAQLLALGEKPAGKRLDLPGELVALSSYEEIILKKSRDAGDVPKEERQQWEGPICVPGEMVLPDGRLLRLSVLDFEEIPEEIPKNQYTKWFDYDRMKFTVWLRRRKAGDFLRIDGAGNRKTLQRYFIDAKIPGDCRDDLPLLAEGSHVIWIIGHRISEEYKVTKATRRVLCAQVVSPQE